MEFDVRTESEKSTARTRRNRKGHPGLGKTVRVSIMFIQDCKRNVIESCFTKSALST